MSHRFFAILTVVVLALAACGDDDTTTESGSSPTSAPENKSSTTGSDEDCGDFECGESCETHPEKYEVCQLDGVDGGFTESGRAPVGDSSWFEDGLFGSYGVSGNFVYGAISACTDFWAGTGTDIYVLVDGDTNNQITMTVTTYEETSGADIEFDDGRPSEAVDDIFDNSGPEPRFSGTLSTGEEFSLARVNEDEESTDCVDPEHGE